MRCCIKLNGKFKKVTVLFVIMVFFMNEIVSAYYDAPYHVLWWKLKFSANGRNLSYSYMKSGEYDWSYINAL